jgi:hypothetical protein
MRKLSVRICGIYIIGRECIRCLQSRYAYLYKLLS